MAAFIPAHSTTATSGAKQTVALDMDGTSMLLHEHVENQAPVQPANVPNQPANVDNADEMAHVEGEQADEWDELEQEGEWDELEQEGITDRVALFLAHLRSRSSQTFSNINHVVQKTSSLFGDIVGRLKTKTMSLFSHFGHDQSPQVQELWQEFSDAAEPFKGLETDYKQIKYFTNSGNFIQPLEEFFPGVSYVQHRDSATGSVRQLAVTDSYQRIPLKPLLVKILELPGISQAMMQWQEKERHALQDVFDGKFCKRHPLFLKEVSVPLLLHNDDCETVNPLGSKTGVHKLGFVYFILKSLPPDLLSNLQSHFLLAVYKSDDAKTYGIDVVLRPIVDELKTLERDGITVNTRNYQGVVKFSIVQVVGDNLGLNGILGYNESFSGNHVCRLCTVHRDVLRVQTQEDSKVLRDVDSHKADLETNDPSKTGLKRDSVLNSLSFYHVTDNKAVDIMHDILEGVGAYEVKLVLNSLIEQKLISPDKLNYRITSFDYGFSDMGNKPSVISKSDLKSQDSPLRQSAAQMWCLLRLLPVMIGDLIPNDNKEWELLIVLLMCMEIIFSPSVTLAATRYLSQIIEDHHSLFLELYPHLHLRPKHHFMLHYPKAIEKLGPLIQLWSMRFEGKHGFFKRVSHVTCNFRNICKTMAYRHQIMQCYTFMCGSMLSHNTEIGPGYNTFLANLEGYKDIQSGLAGIPLFTELYVPARVTVKGTLYRSGMSVFMSYDEDGEPLFGLLKNIFVLEQTGSSQIKFVVQKWETLGYDKHLFAYSVIRTKDLTVIDVKELLDHHPLHAVKSYRERDDNKYISLHYRLF